MKTKTTKFDQAREEIITRVEELKGSRKISMSDVYDIVNTVCDEFHTSRNSMVYSLGIA